nr:restriction endonuclease subunit S [uncultured Lachnoanaerobaculum sp.]
MAKYKLGDICEIVSGSTPKTDIEEYWNGDIKWITPAELDDESYIVYDTTRKITELAVKKTGLSSFPEGTVILSSRAPIGKVAIAGCEMYCNQGFKNLICSEKIYNRYLFWFLKGNTEYLNSFGRGATFKEISKKIVSDIEINVPEMNLQKNAVLNLERLSKIISLRKSEIDKLDALIRARFVEMFGDPSVNNKRWQRGVINEIGSCIAGATPSTKVDEYWNNGTIPWMSSGEVNKGRIDRTDNFITHLGYDKTSTKLVPPKTVVLAMAGQGRTRGMAAITEIDLCTNQSICSIVNNEKIDAEYLLYFLKLQYNELRRASTNTDGRGGLNLKIIGNYPIMIPPVGLQKRFANFVEQVNKSKLLAASQPQIHIYKTLTLL